jgi:RNA polymerase sigma factor (sigma-70 family)
MPTQGRKPSENDAVEQYPMRAQIRPKLRRVVIEEELDHPNRQRRLREDGQQRALDYARLAGGYADDVDPHAYGPATFRRINERRQLDKLDHADTVVPLLDDWNHWARMDDWPSRNRLLDQLTTKARKRTATQGEILFLLVVCQPMIMRVAGSLRRARCGGETTAAGAANRSEARLIDRIDRAEFRSLAQAVLLDAFYVCPQPFPYHFFSWLENYLAHRALDQIRGELAEHDDAIELSDLDRVLGEAASRGVRVAPASYREWIQTWDVQSMFELADEFAGYRTMRSACRKAVQKLAHRQRDVIEQHYYEELTQASIAAARGVAESTVRNTHRAALANLRKDETLFALLEAIGRVRRDPTPVAAHAA